jgi:hypothetical protein
MLWSIKSWNAGKVAMEDNRIFDIHFFHFARHYARDNPTIPNKTQRNPK